jgi:hypothetical protein
MTLQKFRKVQDVNRNYLNIKEGVIESVAAMESSYYNVVAPPVMGVSINSDRKGTQRKKPKTGYRHMMPTPCINQRDDDFPDVKWSCME